MNKYERFALSHYLSAWNSDKSFDAVVEDVREDSQDVAICSIYEDMDTKSLASLIAELAKWSNYCFPEAK